MKVKRYYTDEEAAEIDKTRADICPFCKAGTPLRRLPCEGMAPLFRHDGGDLCLAADYLERIHQEAYEDTA